MPVSDRKALLAELHSTHLESSMMKRLSRGRFFWPGYSADIEQEFKKCLECRVEGISKPNKPCQVLLEDLTILAPAEQISIDFAESGTQDLLIIKDKASGFLEVVKTRDKTTASAIKALHGWIYTFGLPHGCKTDGGPSFKGRFKEYLSTDERKISSKCF